MLFSNRPIEQFGSFLFSGAADLRYVGNEHWFMQRSTDILQQLTTLHQQQIGTLSPALSAEPRQISIRELEEYLRRSDRIRELDRELSLVMDEERRRAV